jgi:hypothetical protein
MQTPPEFLGLLQDFFPGPHLDIADHIPGKMFKDQGTGGRRSVSGHFRRNMACHSSMLAL